MSAVRSLNWEEELLTNGLSERARRVGVAYAGPGAGGDLAPRGLDRPPITFTGGIPDPASLPIEGLRRAMDHVFETEGHDMLQYGGSQGLPALREWLAAHWSAMDAIEMAPDWFCLTNGSAGALANICDTFLNEGDIVIVESPSFPGSIRAIRSFGCEVEAAPMDDLGLDVDALEAQLATIDARGRRAKLLYTIPNYHNPTGTCLPPDRRVRLLELCERYNLLIIEDDAYGEIGFEAELPRSLFSMARGRGVIKAGSFSKIIATGLRVGWCLATPPVIKALLAMRFDLGGNPMVQRMIYHYAKDGALDTHIAEVRRVYESKRDAMMQALDERCAALATWREPQGGFFSWLHLKGRVDPVELMAAAREEGVLFVPGRNFQVEAAGAPNGSTEFVRLAYSYTAETDIAEGVRRVARALERTLVTGN